MSASNGRQIVKLQAVNSCCSDCEGNTNGILEDVLASRTGSTSKEMFTVGVSVDPTSIIYLVIGAVASGYLIKKF